MYRNRRLSPLVLILVCVAGISGCQLWQTTEELPPPDPTAPKVDWVNHVRAATLLQEWQIQGKIGVRTAADAGSAYLDWSQSFDSFYILLSGPLGQGSTIISGNPYGARLENSNGTHISASPQQLVYEHTGWVIPIEHLPYWVKGIPSPRGESTLEYNELGTLSGLRQDGWQLEFDRYGDLLGTLLPQRIKLQRDDLKVTLVIKEWSPLNNDETGDPTV